MNFKTTNLTITLTLYAFFGWRTTVSCNCRVWMENAHLKPLSLTLYPNLRLIDDGAVQLQGVDGAVRRGGGLPAVAGGLPAAAGGGGRWRGAARCAGELRHELGRRDASALEFSLTPFP